MFFENEVQLPIIITVDPENADPARISSLNLVRNIPNHNSQNKYFL